MKYHRPMSDEEWSKYVNPITRDTPVAIFAGFNNQMEEVAKGYLAEVEMKNKYGLCLEWPCAEKDKNKIPNVVLRAITKHMSNCGFSIQDVEMTFEYKYGLAKLCWVGYKELNEKP